MLGHVPATDVFEDAGIRWHVTAGRERELRTWLGACFPKLFEDPACRIKDGKGTRVARAGGWVIKESSARKGRSAARFGLRLSGARRVFNLGHRLVQVGVPTATPVAWATVRRMGLRVREYLLTEEIRDVRVLTHILKEGAPAPEFRRQILEELGRLVAVFHANGYSNRDLKDGNILVAAGPAGVKLWTVDMDGAHRWPCIPRLRARHDYVPVIRSLGIHGWATPGDLEVLLDAYNKHVPQRLRMGPGCVGGA